MTVMGTDQMTESGSLIAWNQDDIASLLPVGRTATVKLIADKLLHKVTAGLSTNGRHYVHLVDCNCT